MIQFIHAADIHLDSPLRGLERYEGAPVEEIRLATRRALENMVQLAITEKVQFVLIAGDIYDGDWKDYNTGLFFVKMMSKLQAADILVFIISGNHDAASQVSKNLSLPANVRILNNKKPETITIPDLSIAIHGQGFSQRVITNNLALHYPKALPDCFNIGMLHTSASGREGHESYAPCSVEQLLEKGYDYWALGHVHTREILHQTPWIVFPGNIQGRHIRETGGKGATLVTVEEQQILSVEHKNLDVFRWKHCEVSAVDLEYGEDVVVLAEEKIQEIMNMEDGFPAGIRLRITGSCRAHHELSKNPTHWINEIRAVANNLNVWLEKINIQTCAEINWDELGKQDDPIGGLIRTLDEMILSEDKKDRWAGDFAELQRRIPAELQEGLDAIDLKSPEKFSELCEDIKHFLIPQLLSKGDSP
ncbi:MAG: DNA repair exonuclease [SAR324 cluster bacterium]|nr:DNA repair exonuclease [SAR324 cluster bacterium]